MASSSSSDVSLDASIVQTRSFSGTRSGTSKFISDDESTDKDYQTPARKKRRTERSHTNSESVMLQKKKKKLKKKQLDAKKSVHEDSSDSEKEDVNPEKKMVSSTQLSSRSIKKMSKYESCGIERKKVFTGDGVVCMYSSHDSDQPQLPICLCIQRNKEDIILQVPKLYYPMSVKLGIPTLDETQTVRWENFCKCCQLMLSGLRMKFIENKVVCSGYSIDEAKEIYQKCLEIESTCGTTFNFIMPAIESLYQAYKRGFCNGDGRHALTMLLTCCKYILGISHITRDVMSLGGNNPKNRGSTTVLKVVSTLKASSENLIESATQEMMTEENLPYEDFIPDFVMGNSVFESDFSDEFYLYGEVKSSGCNEITMYNQLWHQMLGGLTNRDIVHGLAISLSHYVVSRIEICGDKLKHFRKSVYAFVDTDDNSGYKVDIKRFLKIVQHLMKIIQDNDKSCMISA